MQIPEKASLLRIFIGEDDKADGKPLYRAIVLKARETYLAGATVLRRGPLGFGRSSMLHTAKVLPCRRTCRWSLRLSIPRRRSTAFSSGGGRDDLRS
jgi:Uncharacterized ACR, COG1993